MQIKLPVVFIWCFSVLYDLSYSFLISMLFLYYLLSDQCFIKMKANYIATMFLLRMSGTLIIQGLGVL